MLILARLGVSLLDRSTRATQQWRARIGRRSCGYARVGRFADSIEVTHGKLHVFGMDQNADGTLTHPEFSHAYARARARASNAHRFTPVAAAGKSN